MTVERESILNKIRALLSKTLDKGCTEAEAMAALGKAQALQDAYAITESRAEPYQGRKSHPSARAAGDEGPPPHQVATAMGRLEVLQLRELA
jgi:uncharacterized protein DUF2786